MSGVEIFTAVSAGVILFLFGIEQFSREVQTISGARFRKGLARGTKNRLLGFLLGGAVTAVIQSSTATSVIAVGLVNAGVLSFRSSLGILFGGNVGTTVTAQLVALKLTAFAPGLILAGFVIGLLPFRWRVLGRSIFYFGLVFFSLNLVSSAVAPLRDDPALVGMLARADGPLVGVLVGAVFTAIVQSSSVSTGLVIVLLQERVLTFDVALPMILGANVGTTVTALLAAASFDTSARRTAVSHLLYNVLGVILFLPFLGPFGRGLLALDQEPAETLALAHFGFNFACAALFLALLGPFARLVERIVPDDAPDEPIEPPPRASGDEVDPALDAAWAWVGKIIERVEPSYTAAVLAIQTRDRKIENRAARNLAIVQFGIDEGRDLAGQLARRTLSEVQSTRILRLVVTLDHLRQLADSLEDLMHLGASLERRAGRLSMDALLDIQRVYPLTSKLFATLAGAFSDPAGRGAELSALDAELRGLLAEAYRRFIELARGESEGSELADFLSIHQRLRTKVSAFAAHLGEG